MTALAPSLTAFLREHLPRERRASPHTCDAYAFSFQLLVSFAAMRLKTRPSLLEIEHLDVPMILTFLEHLESERANAVRSRNARLAAIKAFFRYLEHRLPSSLDQALRVHAIPMKKFDQGLVATLSLADIQALLNAPDPRSRSGVRDRAMLHLAFAAGLRVSELVELQINQFDPRPPVSIHVIGKGRRERVLPLWRETAAAIKAWLAIRPQGADTALFLSNVGRGMTRAGFEYILDKHVQAAAAQHPSIAEKKVSPHVLRHSCAMHMLKATHDIRKVALWLGHASLQSTEIYLRVDPSEKLEALGAASAPNLKAGRFKPPDRLIAMLNGR